MHDALLLRDIAMRAKKYLVVRPSAAYIVGTQIYIEGRAPARCAGLYPTHFLIFRTLCDFIVCIASAFVLEPFL